MARGLFVSLALVAACGGSEGGNGVHAAPVKEANDVLVLGSFERRPPLGTTAIAFAKDGTVRLAHDKSKLDKETIATGTWSLDKDQLTINYTEGECAQDGPGRYTITLSKIGIRFVKVDDACESRSKIDGQVWRRIE